MNVVKNSPQKLAQTAKTFRADGNKPCCDTSTAAQKPAAMEQARIPASMAVQIQSRAMNSAAENMVAACLKNVLSQMIETHCVQKGDTLYGIAAQHGLPISEIIRANPQLANPHQLLPGQRISLVKGIQTASKDTTQKDSQAVERPVGQHTGSEVNKVESKAIAPEQSSGLLTADQLRQISPRLSAKQSQEIVPHLNRAMAEANINTPGRKAAFIAQLAHESGSFKYNEEIASGRAYEGRRDLGNTQPGDGMRYKGRGYIQLTGRANYREAGKALGLDLENNPGLASRPENAARVAAWYWNKHNLNSYADRGDFDAITRKINGGYNGKADRDQYYAKAKSVFFNSIRAGSPQNINEELESSIMDGMMRVA
jgi:predicted chitinase